MFRRLIAVILSLMIVFSCLIFTVSAAAAVKFKFDYDKPSPEELGYAGYAAELDKTPFYGQLGAIYTKKSTTFRLWSPVASSVHVCIYKTGSDDEPGAQKLNQTPMHYSEQYGTWYVTLNGDFKNRYYTYRVTIGDQTNEVVDPYAKAVGVNGNRGMVVDLSETDPEGWAEDRFDRKDYASEAVVWEVSVRDFSADESSGVSPQHRGKYLAFTESGTTLNGEGSIATCVDYLKELGVSYVQIGPFYDFASIDEADTETEQYNWGYDPKNYNVPEGSYSSDPYDGRVRIKECKQMIQALHEAGIGVIMDVVYNHTYFSEDSFFNLTVPYYYHRINQDGTWSQGSGCGNDVATERKMVRRFIRDSVVYWAQEYHIDGFRFDLMGLMDVDTMNSIRATLDQLDGGSSIIMYGEAWKMNTAVPDGVKLANQDNVNLLSKRIGAFNDTGREGIRQFVREGSPKSGVRSSVSANGANWTDTPNRCVNYVSCHDNLTLYDALVNAVYRDKQYTERREDLVAMNRLAAAVVLLSRGMPFFLAGEEMGRTKQGDGNSYISPIEINRIDWNNLRLYTSLTDYYRGLIALRSATGVFNDPTGNRSELSYLETKDKGVVAYTASKDGRTVLAAFNGNPGNSTVIELPAGEWVILADRNRAGLASLGTVSGTLTVEPTSAMVLIDAESYPSVAVQGEDAAVYVRYVDSAAGNVMREQRAVGAMGEDYELDIPIDIAYRYNLSGETEALTGAFDAPYRLITLTCEEYTGKFSSVTFNFIDGEGQPVADAVVISNRVGEQYYTPWLASAAGYRLDVDHLPENGAGILGDDPVEVTYRYLSEAGESTPDEPAGACRINVIYMSDQGKILGTERFTGADGEAFTPERKSFGGYDYVGMSSFGGAFSTMERSVLLNYSERPSDSWIWFVIGGGVILFAAGVFFLLRFFDKRRMIRSIEIEE